MTKTTITAISAHPDFRRFDLEKPEPLESFLTVVGRSPRVQIILVDQDGMTDFDLLIEQALASGDRDKSIMSCPPKPTALETRVQAINRAGIIAEITNIPLVTACPTCRRAMTRSCIPRCRA